MAGETMGFVIIDGVAPDPLLNYGAASPSRCENDDVCTWEFR